MKDVYTVSTEPYLFFSATRGPDMNEGPLAYVLKHITAKLRGLIYTDLECKGAMYINPSESWFLLCYTMACAYPTKVEELALQEEWQRLSHYRNHLASALRSLHREVFLTAEESAIRYRLLQILNAGTYNPTEFRDVLNIGVSRYAKEGSNEVA